MSERGWKNWPVPRPKHNDGERLRLRVYNPRSGNLGISYVSGPIRSGEREYVEAARADALAEALRELLDAREGDYVHVSDYLQQKARADELANLWHEAAARADALAEALRKIAQMSPDGTGTLRPIWREYETVKIAKDALARYREGKG